MRRMIACMLLILVVNFMYSLDVIIESIVDIPEQRISGAFFFNDVLFYTGGRSFMYLQQGELQEPILEIRQNEKLGSYGYISELQKSIKDNRLFFYISEYRNQSYYCAYEIKVDREGNIQYFEVDKNTVENADWSHKDRIVNPIFYSTVFNEKIVYFTDFDVKLYERKHEFYLEKNSEKVFDFLTAYPPYYFRSFDINDKVNWKGIIKVQY